MSEPGDAPESSAVGPAPVSLTGTTLGLAVLVAWIAASALIIFALDRRTAMKGTAAT